MYAMVQRFPTRDAKEFMNMFVLTPLEETVTVKNIVAKSTVQAEARGEARGERIGQIQLLQRMLHQPVNPKEDLTTRSLEALDALVKQLKAQIH